MSELAQLLISLPSFKLYGLSQVSRSLRLLFKAYFHDYKYPQFRTSLDYSFYSYFVPKLNEVLSKGFSPEIIALRPYIDDLILRLSAGSSPMEHLGRSIELDVSTGKTLDEIGNMLRVSANANLALSANGFKAIKTILDQQIQIAMADTKSA